jgi:hypothetical protein
MRAAETYLEMACHAIHRDIVLPVTLNAEAHVQIDGANGHRLLRQVTMTLSTGNARANVRGVIELHVRGRFKSVDALPRHVFSIVEVGGKFLDLGLAGRDYAMTVHAEIRAGDAGVGPLVDSYVAIGALHAIGNVDLMGELDRLNRFRTIAEELFHRFPYRAVSGGEDLGRRGRGGGRSRLAVRGGRMIHNQPCQECKADNGRNANPAFDPARRKRQVIPLGEELQARREIVHTRSEGVNGELRYLGGE